MRVQTSVPLGNWPAVGPAARAAGATGFDGIMFPEIANDPFIPVALAALATERIELGTAIVVAFPRSPMVVANSAWDLQVHSRGRFVLGLGSQVKGHNERRFSVPWSAPAPRLREYVESLRAIWRAWEKREPLRYEGQHYRVTFYGSTRSYRPVLSAHGWDDLGNELHRMSVRGEWSQMAAKVSDEVVHAFAACATHRDLPAAVEKRFGGLTDAIGLGFAKDPPAGLARGAAPPTPPPPAPPRRPPGGRRGPGGAGRAEGGRSRRAASPWRAEST